MTMSTSSSASRSSSEACARMPWVAANAVARSGSRSVAATRRISGCVKASLAYPPAMFPVPTMPMPSGVMDERLRHRRGPASAHRPPRASLPYRARMRHDQTALQLYTLRRLAAEDLAGTLRSVSAAGYRAAELAGLPETAPAELKRMLDDNGLQAIASHEGIERLRADAGAVAGRLVELGCPRVIVPWMPEDDRATAAAVRAFASELGEYARRMAEDGIRLGYHNHDFEFRSVEETTIWDILLGALPADVELGAIADRVRLLHMKDRSAGPTPHDAPVGEGILPMAGIVQAADTAGVEWFIVEQDEPAEPLANIATS